MNTAKHEPRDSDGHYRCQTCGYDLHDNESGQCPECGASLAGVDYIHTYTEGKPTASGLTLSYESWYCLACFPEERYPAATIRLKYKGLL